MDIQKEREAFEEHLAGMNIHNLRVGTIFDTEKNEYFASDVLHPSEDHIVGWINFSWKLWQAKATPEGFVLVPKECPDPIFADKLFDHLCKKAHGEFGDDQMIFFSDIDESAIWQLMIEAQEQSHD